jgi:3-oxoacyl-[acyl-carrier-protein] synthase III
MKGKIISCGGYLPVQKLTNDDLAKTVDTSDEWITTRTGIKQRFIAAENQAVSDMALEASLVALENINEIDGIIFATSTQDLSFPSSACILQRKLIEKGKKVNGFAFDLIAACAGFVYAVSNANAMIRTGLAKRVLVIGADAVSRAIDWNDRETCVLFGDGAGAVVVEATENDDPRGIIDCEIKADGRYTEILRTTCGPTQKNVPLHIIMEGKKVFVHAVEKMSNSIQNLMNKNNITESDLNFIVPHQANIRILEAVSTKLKIPEEKFVMTIQKHANTSAATIPLALWEVQKQNTIKQGDTIILEALGGGLVWGGVLLKW